MNNAIVAKVAGWGQLLINILTQVSTVGIPKGVVGWAGMLASLAVAVGTHAASSTDGAK